MDRNIALILLVLLFPLPARTQVFTDSNLPIIVINTDNGAVIPDEPGVLGDMQIIYRGPGLRNYLADTDSVQYLDYTGRIDIEVRGSYSQVFPKKSYGFTTKLADNISNNNVSLLGMPSENDWVLNGISSDPSLIRDYLCYNLSRQIGLYASRTVYCEVLVNGDYRGLYILQEKIKADKDRVDILKIDTGDNSLPELSGGYITKTDKTTGGDPVAWYMSGSSGFNDNAFIHHWPKPENVSPQQTNYIKSVFLNLQAACTAGNASITDGYPSLIDIPSFVDYILVNEISSNVDAYSFSTFYHKDRNGKLRAGPAWDMNLTYGNDLFSFHVDRSRWDVWQFSNGSIEGPKYYRDLFNNAQFKCYLSRRWNELTQSGLPFSLASIESFIDTTVARISEAVAREQARWGTVGNHTDSILDIKNWLSLRIPWMTGHLGSYSACQNVWTPPLVISAINYHPEATVAFPDEDRLEFLGLTNAATAPIDLTGIYFGGTGLVYRFPVGSSLAAGNSLYLAGDSIVFQARYGMPAFGQFTRNLSNADENLLLLDAFGNEVDHVHYYDDPPWPDADGNGMFLQLISVALDNSLAPSWIAVNDNTVGTDRVPSRAGLRVYPNPARERVRVTSGIQIEFLDICDLQGRHLARYAVEDKEFLFDSSRLPAGIYFLKIFTYREILYGKFVRE